jgi:hypothetical protein
MRSCAASRSRSFDDPLANGRDSRVAPTNVATAIVHKSAGIALCSVRLQSLVWRITCALAVSWSCTSSTGTVRDPRRPFRPMIRSVAGSRCALSPSRPPRKCTIDPMHGGRDGQAGPTSCRSLGAICRATALEWASPVAISGCIGRRPGLPGVLLAGCQLVRRSDLPSARADLVPKNRAAPSRLVHVFQIGRAESRPMRPKWRPTKPIPRASGVRMRTPFFSHPPPCVGSMVHLCRILEGERMTVTRHATSRI